MTMTTTGVVGMLQQQQPFSFSEEDAAAPAASAEEAVVPQQQGGSSCEQECDARARGAQTDTNKTPAVPIDVPLFLQNTYRMIDTCDPSIASWSHDGKAFVIKDTEKLGSNIIPMFFKHNKLTSFVRQLNFYGFKKVRRDPFLSKPNNAADNESSKRWWRFRHEFFMRDRPDLLREIRRPYGQNAPIEREEIDSLKNEVRELKCQIDSLLRHIRISSHLGSSHSKEEPQGAAAKKRPAPSGTTCSWQEEAQPTTTTTGVTATGEYDHHQFKRRRLSISPPSSPQCPFAESAVISPHSSPAPEPPFIHHFDATALSDRDLLLECAIITTPERTSGATDGGTSPIDGIQRQQRPQPSPDQSLLQSALDCIEPIDIFRQGKTCFRQAPSRSREVA